MPDLMGVYKKLLKHYGALDWWPAKSPFEVIIGAILTQNTNWNNVEKAIANLRRADALNPETILQITHVELEQLIRPSGFFRQKSKRLKIFCQHLQDHHHGQLDLWLQQDLNELRDELLTLKGIGPETADSILLYAGHRPSFVVDSYTGRLFSRLGLLSGQEKYNQIRTLFMSNLDCDVQLYNEYHALIVIHCKEYCRKRPLCSGCPLYHICLYSRENS